MPDEMTGTEATEAEAPKATEPQGDETDWKAEARKWEKRAKDSKKDFDRVNKVLEGYEAKSKEDEAKEKTAAEALEAAQAEIARLTAEREREALARGIAKKANVSAEVLVLMRGDTEEEIEANAKLLAESTKPRWPEVKDGGHQKAPGKSKEDILAIKNPREQLRAAAQNLSAFD